MMISKSVLISRFGLAIAQSKHMESNIFHPSYNDHWVTSISGSVLSLASMVKSESSSLGKSNLTPNDPYMPS